MQMPRSPQPAPTVEPPAGQACPPLGRHLARVPCAPALRRALTAGLACLVLFLAGGCGRGGPIPSPSGGSPDPELSLLAEWMTGHFSSASQAAADSSYFDIRLAMIPIWTARGEDHWLYVEQAVAGREEAPYRQRVYHLTRSPAGSLQSVVYELPHPERYVGAWRSPAVFAALAPTDLERRAGCAIELHRTPEGEFVGGTVDRRCASSLRGARYATSEVRIGPHEMVSWDRGFNQAGEQVWGATEGGYVFRKLR